MRGVIAVLVLGLGLSACGNIFRDGAERVDFRGNEIGTYQEIAAKHCRDYGQAAQEVGVSEDMDGTIEGSASYSRYACVRVDG